MDKHETIRSPESVIEDRTLFPSPHQTSDEARTQQNVGRASYGEVTVHETVHKPSGAEEEQAASLGMDQESHHNKDPLPVHPRPHGTAKPTAQRPRDYVQRVPEPLPAQHQRHAPGYVASPAGYQGTVVGHPGARVSDQRGSLTRQSASNPTSAEELRDQLTSLEQTLKSEGQAHALEVRNLEAKLQDCIHKNQKLNQMIVSMSKRYEPPDKEIETDCSIIEHQIEALIRTHYKSTALVLNSNVMTELAPTQRILYENLKKHPKDAWKYEIRRQIFETLNKRIFSSRCFGLSGEVERGLELFENTLLDNRKVDSTEALEWRTRTIACANLLDGEGGERIHQAQNHLWHLLCPVAITGPKGDSPEAEKDVKKELFDICSKALELTLRFRRSGAKYAFRSFVKDTEVSSCEDEVTLTGLVGETSVPFVPSETLIYCTLFGALIKTRNPLSAEGANRVLLRKARVIVFDPRRRTGPISSS